MFCRFTFSVMVFSSVGRLAQRARTLVGGLRSVERQPCARLLDLLLEGAQRSQGTWPLAGYSAGATVPAEPSTTIRSPVAIRFVASGTPTTAGIPYSRATTAPCDIIPPIS